MTFCPAPSLRVRRRGGRAVRPERSVSSSRTRGSRTRWSRPD